MTIKRNNPRDRRTRNAGFAQNSRSSSANNRTRLITVLLRRRGELKRNDPQARATKCCGQPAANGISNKFRNLCVNTERDSVLDNCIKSPSPKLLTPLFCPAAPSARPRFISISPPSGLHAAICNCNSSETDSDTSEYCSKCGYAMGFYSYRQATEEEMRFICMSPVWGVEY